MSNMSNLDAKRRLAAKIKPGKLVRYTGNFCRWTGNLHPPINGIVLSVDDPAGDGSATARIVWCDYTDCVVTVLVSNVELDPACASSSYPDLVLEFAEGARADRAGS